MVDGYADATYVCNDCDDRDSDINPFARDICRNYIDQKKRINESHWIQKFILKPQILIRQRQPALPIWGYVGNEAYLVGRYRHIPAAQSSNQSRIRGLTLFGVSRQYGPDGREGRAGYQLKGPESQIGTQCHGKEESEGFYDLHEEHVKEERYDCSRCHTFSRPERNLRQTFITFFIIIVYIVNL